MNLYGGGGEETIEDVLSQLALPHQANWLNSQRRQSKGSLPAASQFASPAARLLCWCSYRFHQCLACSKRHQLHPKAAGQLGC